MQANTTLLKNKAKKKKKKVKNGKLVRGEFRKYLIYFFNKTFK